MAIPITGLPNFPTSAQIPNDSILDINGRQAYLCNQFIVGPDTVSLADASEHPILYLLNPSTNTKSLFIYNMNLNAVGATDVITYRIYSASSGVSGGTAATPQNCRLAASNTSNASALTSPSVSSNGTRIQTIAVGFNSQSIKNPLFVIDPGSSILVTGKAATTATAICEFIYYEI